MHFTLCYASVKKAIMKAKLREVDGIKYLSFTPKGLMWATEIPVITKGSREVNNAWTWNGSLDKPTVRPSVRTQYTNQKGEKVMIHYWLNDGVCKCLGDSTDGNKGKGLTLKEVKD